MPPRMPSWFYLLHHVDGKVPWNIDRNFALYLGHIARQANFFFWSEKLTDSDSEDDFVFDGKFDENFKYDAAMVFTLNEIVSEDVCHTYWGEICVSFHCNVLQTA